MRITLTQLRDDVQTIGKLCFWVNGLMVPVNIFKVQVVIITLLFNAGQVRVIS